MCCEMKPNRPSTLSWPRWSAYRLHAHRWVYADGERCEPYEVTGADDLVAHLAAAAGQQGDRLEDRIPRLLKFYEAFGLLGETTLFGARGVIFSRRHEVRAGDSVAWALRHARNIRLILSLDRERGVALDRLMAALAEGRGERPLRGLGRSEDATAVRHQPSLQIPTCIDRRQSVLKINLGEEYERTRASGPGLRLLALRVIGELLNPNLASVPRTFDPDTGEARFRFTALIQAVYWQLADRLGHHKVRRCPCGGLFFQSDPRQRYCPPLLGRKDSQCAQRFRRRRVRNL